MLRNKRLFIALILATGTAAAQPERSSSIAGQVVNATTGAPVNRASVEIILEGRSDVRGMAPTSADGSFLLRALPAGRYLINVSKPGYSDMGYGARYPGAPGQVITLGPNENKSGLMVRLSRLGSISGTILGTSGMIARGSYVSVFRREFPRGRLGWIQAGGATIDDRGQYHIGNLRPGRYIVAAYQVNMPVIRMGTPRSPQETEQKAVPALTYYPSTVIQQEAVPLDIGSGEARRDIDIPIQEMAPVRVSLWIQLPPGVTPQFSQPGAAPRLGMLRAPVWIRGTDGGPGAPMHAFTATMDGQVEYQPVNPGRYILASSMEVEGKCYGARKEIALSGGSVDTLLSYSPCVNLSGHLRITGPGAGRLSGMQVVLNSGENLPIDRRSAEVQADGSFILKDVPPGIWDILPGPIPLGGYLKSMMLGKLDVLAKDMVIAADTKDSLEIVISTRAAQLRGHVENGFASTILAAPQGELASVQSFYLATGADENGDFEFRNLAPGAYRIYAFESMAPGAWRDPEFLKSYPGLGTPVELGEGRASDIKVTAIPGAPAERRSQ
ncbi:carboxypeptidase regulatory-like domain-containing protein [Paludibaculum fermentans]|uniref:Carboxypeptidase regulatory-like domain-containing protein n=1 Tax=Paludibaculum fermentans TaxID=1473598 RepID=A0A7S7SKA9_PALFE|nr:carboxypeptidase regulatory-like domain-containing protein [Paludibaculum fermentans]QOY88104.1 carboxypeptidase regulatory-like domain-containing protein [Paludibaculum fermentans]